MKYLNTLYSVLFLAVCNQGFSQSTLTITEARATNSDGVILRDGEAATLEGIAVGPNFRPGGQTFVLHDRMENIGITVFSLDSDFGYTVNDGDVLSVTGSLTQFNGLAEIVPTQIEVIASENVPDPVIVTQLDEQSESNLVTIRNVALADPSQWENGGSFNVDLTDGVNSFVVRIDSDVDISGMLPPTGTFDITGLGGQFDNSEPFDEGYQLFPRSVADISPYNTGVVTYTSVTMAELRENNTSDLNPLLFDQRVETTAVVHGINLRADGLLFTIIDENNQGVSVFSADDQFGYIVEEGDMVTVRGLVGSFAGLTQIILEDIELVSTGNDVVVPRGITALDETTESSLVSINPVSVEDASRWFGDGNDFSVNLISTSGDTVNLRIDGETEVADIPSFPGTVDVAYIGIGGQFDTDNDGTLDNGYQMTPRYNDDIVLILSTDNQNNIDFIIYPNPASEFIIVDSVIALESVSLYTLNGHRVITSNSNIISLEGIDLGMYIIELSTANGKAHQKIIVNK